MEFKCFPYQLTWEFWTHKLQKVWYHSKAQTTHKAHWEGVVNSSSMSHVCRTAVIDGRSVAFISIYFPALWFDWRAHVNGLLDLWFGRPLMYWQASNAPLAEIKATVAPQQISIGTCIWTETQRCLAYVNKSSESKAPCIELKVRYTISSIALSSIT